MRHEEFGSPARGTEARQAAEARAEARLRRLEAAVWLAGVALAAAGLMAVGAGSVMLATAC